MCALVSSKLDISLLGLQGFMVSAVSELKPPCNIRKRIFLHPINKRIYSCLAPNPSVDPSFGAADQLFEITPNGFDTGRFAL